ncbi:MAG: FAD binding domain-containing protein [Anaerolineae bacterium]
MDRLIPTAEPHLKRYFVASSVEEAIGYLSAHRGEAQIVGGGTALMPVVLSGRSVASHLVDVTRIGALRRLRLDKEYLLLGGAVTLAQILRADATADLFPILRDMALSTDTPPLRELATLAGSIVSAFGNSSVTIAMSALNAEAEIANLTGSQWLPVRSLLKRPGSGRVNSMSEILVSLRVRLPESGAGAALVRTDAAPGGRDETSAIAVSLGYDGALDLISRFWLVLGMQNAIPDICHLDDLADSKPPTIESVRRAASQWVNARISHSSLPDAAIRAQGAANSAQRAFDIALQRARTGLANGML